MTDLTTVVKNNLSIKYKIESVVIDDKKLKGGFIADIVQLFVYLKSGEMLNCVLKLENNNETLLKNMAKELHLYDREYYFYNVISDYVNIKIPKFYLTIKDSDFKSTGILLENLNNDSFILNLDLNNNPINVSLTVIDRIAKMHSKFWNKNLEIAFDKLKKPNDPSFCTSMSNFVKENWPKFKLKWSNVLSQKQFEIGDIIVHYFNEIQNYLSGENLTLCHGDLKSANIFYKKLNDDSVERDIHFEPYFIDWQYINHGKGVSDIVFFIIESFDILSINKFNDLFQEYYYVKLLEHGVENYSKESYLYDFKISSCFYPFFVAIWFGVISQEDLIDVNFPFFYIQKLFYFLEKNECTSSFLF